MISIPLSGYNRLYGFAALAGVFLLLAFFGTVVLVTRGQRHADAWLRRVAAHVPFTTPDGVSRMLQHVADRITLLLTNRRRSRGRSDGPRPTGSSTRRACGSSSWAFGHVVSPIDLLVAYGLANILAVLPITPGGLGVIEGVLIPTLVGFRVPGAIATVGVLVVAARQLLAADPSRGRVLPRRFASGTVARRDRPARLRTPARASGGAARSRGPSARPGRCGPQSASRRRHRWSGPSTQLNRSSAKVPLEHVDELVDQRRVGDRRRRLDAPVEVALHQVRRADAARDGRSGRPAVPNEKIRECSRNSPDD